MTTAVMGRNVLRLKRNMHQTGGPQCACGVFDLQQVMEKKGFKAFKMKSD